MKILVTGICGFVGSSLVLGWKEAGATYTFYGVDSLTRRGSEINRCMLEKTGVKVFHGDIRVASDFDVLPKVDMVIDAAANPSVLAGLDGKSSSRQLIEHNLLGTVNALEYCKNNRAGLILLSTSRVYSIKPLAELPINVVNAAYQPTPSKSWPTGFSAAGVSEEFSTAPPVSLYGATKIAAEALALEYGDVFDVPVWINRCGVLGGAGQFGHAEQGIFSFWIHSWVQKRALRYIGFGGNGYQVRDLLHPRDILPVLEKQMGCTDKSRSRIVNLSGGIENCISLAQLSEWCRDRFGARDVGSEFQERPFDIPWLVLDSSRAQSLWKWKPARTLQSILDEIAVFAVENPAWLDMSSLS
jgi:CDP-paratose 2-epimerase